MTLNLTTPQYPNCQTGLATTMLFGLRKIKLFDICS